MRLSFFLLLIMASMICIPLNTGYSQCVDRNGFLHFITNPSNNGKQPSIISNIDSKPEAKSNSAIILSESDQESSSGAGTTKKLKTGHQIRAEQKALSKTSEELQEEKEAIEQEVPQDDASTEEKGAYQDRIDEYNQKLDQYNKDKSQYQQDIDTFSQYAGHPKHPSQSNETEQQ